MQRRERALQVRIRAAQAEFQTPPAEQAPNGDEDAFANKIANFSKALPHNQLGEPDLSAYGAFLQALSTGNPADFENIPMGSSNPDAQLKMVDPQSGLAFDLEGADSHALALPPPPAFSSAQEAGEIVENYWSALARDVPFREYGSNPITQNAAADLTRMSDFRGPKVKGQVTPDILFRGFTTGDVTGPYVSQFLLKPAPFGANFVEQRIRAMATGIDYLTGFAEWLSVQNGNNPAMPSNMFAPQRCYIRCGRDLASWVHVDVLFQAYFIAGLILLTPPDANDPLSGGIGAPFNPGFPYHNSLTQTGFGTFGGPYVAAQIAEVATRALKAVWYQKWFVHRRLRPEEFGGRIHVHLSNRSNNYPIHSDVLGSAALSAVHAKTGSYLLPQAFPEGCPIHPSYGAGHATVAGACVTLLKALFDENHIVPNPVEASSDGLALLPYTGPDADRLTVGGELNKLAANIAIGRNIAGVHWRSDYAESVKLGEAVAISVLRDQRSTYNENFAGFTFTRFDGTKVTV